MNNKFRNKMIDILVYPVIIINAKKYKKYKNIVLPKNYKVKKINDKSFIIYNKKLFINGYYLKYNNKYEVIKIFLYPDKKEIKYYNFDKILLNNFIIFRNNNFAEKDILIFGFYTNYKNWKSYYYKLKKV